MTYEINAHKYLQLQALEDICLFIFVLIVTIFRMSTIVVSITVDYIYSQYLGQLASTNSNRDMFISPSPRRLASIILYE